MVASARARTGGAEDPWQPILSSLVQRFDREYRGEPFDLPAEAEAMPLFRERIAGTLQAHLTSPFWDLARISKGQRCLDIGCGVSFLIYPWAEWGAFFYGQEISAVARDALNGRGPQLNSKLFKGVQLGPAHSLNYDPGQFDVVIATGFSCYFPPEYWRSVLSEVQRVLRPGGSFVFDVIDPDTSLAENWAILEMYFGVEVFLEPLERWQQVIREAGATLSASRPGDIFQMYRVTFA
ncbi:methyltransferase domain-containing protein [Leptolyngbya sp. FACHB-261]|uniref:class I SAM-dependent methyltransferase n=1 Tax=Leptolyngbya sp. FACHB-261 TaxID=2692806 RepID=UPI001687C328|nr:methyltransferase domain-containing protein [Leptolyngbya sp. FACHB-261]MBD2099333.1 class I SAM-dependent methyltransferase [Leptolyngbya sp. FACHB-261]